MTASRTYTLIFFAIIAFMSLMNASAQELKSGLRGRKQERVAKMNMKTQYMTEHNETMLVAKAFDIARAKVKASQLAKIKTGERSTESIESSRAELQTIAKGEYKQLKGV